LRLRWLCDGTDRLNWRDVQVVVLEADQGSAIARHELGEAAFWTVDTHRLAGVLDALNGANFQRGGDRGKRPEPGPRARQNATAEPTRDDGCTLFGGTDGCDMACGCSEEMNEWLGLAPA